MPSPTTSSPIVFSTLTGNSYVDALDYGTQWANSNISYSFLSSSFYYATLYPDTSFFQNVQILSLTQQTAIKSALSAWANVAAISFVQSADTSTTVGDIRIAFSWSYSWGNFDGMTYYPSANPSGGDLWLNPAASDFNVGYASGTFANSSFLQGNYSYYTALHELGHALGLKHPFESSPLNSTIEPIAYDSRVFTLMSYTTLFGHPEMTGFTFNPTTPMLLDIAAIQAMYGANYAFNAGDTTYSFNDNPGQHYFQTIWDGGGNNTFAYSGNTNSSIDLRQGYGSAIGNRVFAYSSASTNTIAVNNVWIAWGTHIDMAVCTGYGNNTLQANDDGDTLIGGSGNDTFIVGRGNDTIDGGAGIDTVKYTGNRASYSLTQTATGWTVSSTAEGTDTLNHIEFAIFSDQTTALVAVDITAPSVSTFSPADEATGVAIASNIVCTFSEAIARGIGSIVLKDASGAVIETFNATSSSHLSISGAVLTINPTANLHYGTGYSVELAAGTIQDLTGKSYAGTSSYNFTTTSALNESEVGKLYVAYFNRPGDVGGLAYWEGQLANGVSITTIQNSFSSSAEYQAIYTGQQNTALIQRLYLNLFGREVSVTDSGVLWWAGEMTAGRQTITTIAGALSSGTTPGSADNIAVIDKIAAATAFTNGLDTTSQMSGYSGTAAFTVAGNWLVPVHDAATLTTAMTSLDATIAAAVAASLVGVAAHGIEYTPY